MEIPFQNEFNDTIKNIYQNQYQTNNLLFSEYMKNNKEKIIYNDSIIFFECFDKTQLMNILKNTEENKSMLKAIITRTKCKNEDKLEIINFIIKNKITIFELKDSPELKEFIDFFTKKKDLNYFNIKDIIKKNNDININENNDINNENNFYTYYKFDFLLNEIKYNKMEQNGYNNNLINEIKSKYNLLNIKNAKRLIFEFLSQESLKLFDVKNIIVKIENIINLYEVLCMEYYFNNNENIFNGLLKNSLQKCFLFLLKNDELLNCYNNQYLRKNEELNMSYKKYLLNFDISNSNNENTILKKYFNSFNNIIYDKLLFISKNFDLVDNKFY